MTAAHLAGAAELEKACFHTPWSREALSLLLTDAAAGVVAVSDGAVIGYGGILWGPFEGQITNIAVSPSHRRLGVGYALLAALIRAAEERGLEAMVLEVRESNTPALSLYLAHGFATVGKRPGFYSHPREAALIMQKNLK